VKAIVSGLNFMGREMARLAFEESNELFETLVEWNVLLEHQKSDDFLVPPCP
jgi:hypothetical protein